MRQRVIEGEVRAQRGGGLERLQTNEKRIRVCYKLHIYIYIGRYFSNFVLSLTGSGPGLGLSFGIFFF